MLSRSLSSHHLLTDISHIKLGCPKNPQSLTLTIIRTLWNAVKYAIALLGYPLLRPLVVHRLGLAIGYGSFAILSEWARV